MRQKKGAKKKKWKWMLGSITMLTILFVVFIAIRQNNKLEAADPVYSFWDSTGHETVDRGTTQLRSRTDNYSIHGAQTGDTIRWSTANVNVVGFDNGSSTPVQTVTSDGGAYATFHARTTGKVTITAAITSATTHETKSISMSVEVVFSINENITEVEGVKMDSVFKKDARRALIMNYGTSLIMGQGDVTTGTGSSAVTTFDTSKLQLVFGNASASNVSWTTGNDDILKFSETSGVRKIEATGAGMTTLTVSRQDGTGTVTDSIKVYVRPRIYKAPISPADRNANALTGAETDPAMVTVSNGDKLYPSIENSAHPEIAVNQKIRWVISKDVSGDGHFMRDSLNHGDGLDPDEINLVYNDVEKAYTVRAKAGVYHIQFFPGDSYVDFAALQNPNSEEHTQIAPVNLKTSVNCSFTDKTETIGLHGTYNLSEAFNIPLAVLREKFTISISTAPGDASATYVSLDDDRIVHANALGTAKIFAKPVEGVTIGSIPGLTSLDEITLTVVVSDTFSLNITQTTVAVGTELSLYGIIGSNAAAEDKQFEWTVSDSSIVSLDKTDGQYVTATTLRSTPTNSPVQVTLAWTDRKGVTWKASCRITVTDDASSFQLTPSSVVLGTGEEKATLDTGLSGIQNIRWLTSDPSIVTIEVAEGTKQATISTKDKTGEAVITAINLDNPDYTATCKVRVIAKVTALKIKVNETEQTKVEGDTCKTIMSERFVYLSPQAQPNDPHFIDSDWKWESDNTNVATIDASGKVTLKSIGTASISLWPVYNPNYVHATMKLVVKGPLSNITTDITSKDMLVGESYQVRTTMTPEDPSDPILKWESDNPSIASVDNNGKITAVGPGTTNIWVTGVGANGFIRKKIVITVRRKLTSIAFEKDHIEIAVEEVRKLNVIFEPNDGINTGLTFKSFNEDIVTVDSNGNVTGKAEGTASVLCTSVVPGISPILCEVVVSKKPIEATEYSISPEKKTIRIEDTFQIISTFVPEETTDKTVKYKSTDEDILSVTDKGVVKGLKAGVAAIQCYATSGEGHVATCLVTVETPVKFSLSPPSRELAKGHSFTIKKVTVPANADKSATWKSSNTAVATVNASGKVVGRKYGSCTITATLNHFKVTAKCHVKVTKLKSSVKLNKSSIRLNIGQTYQLKKTVTTNGTKNPSVKFTSKNKKIATVGSSSGRITAKKVGSTIITAKTTDSVHATAKCRVIVIRRVSSLSLNKTYAICYVGRTTKLKATIKPKNSSIKKIKWSSSNTKIANVTGSGKVTGITAGEIYVTAATTDGGNKKARCLVKVMEQTPATSVLIAQSSLTMKKGESMKLSYTVLPHDNSDSIKIASNNTKIVKVVGSKIKAVGTGVAEVSITTSSGVSAKVDVNVVAFNKTSIRMRQYDTETITIMGSSDTATWYSGNNRIATISNGKIVAKGTGTTYVYAWINGCKLSCKVEVVSINTKKR